VAAAGALLAPAAAQATPVATAARSVSPVVTSISPKSPAIGGVLTIRGRNFVRGKGRNSVVFRRDGARAVFVKADLSTGKLLTVKLPPSLAKFLVQRDGQVQPTRFRLRVLARRLGARFTRNALSPLVKPEPSAATPPPVVVTGDCGNAEADLDGDRVKNGVDADDDDDLLTDTQEKGLELDPCNRDTDGDKVDDGYEWRSALDLNDDEDEEPNTFLPYPGKKPYPNALDGADANIDFDGDSLTLSEEQALWKYTVARGAPLSLGALTYSDGEQYTASARGADGHRVPTLAAATYDKWQCFLDWADPAKEDACRPGDVEHGYLEVMLQQPGRSWHDARTPFDIRDTDRDGDLTGQLTAQIDRDRDSWLSDDERDEDADGLTNFDETHGCMNPELWKALYKKETPYPIAYAGTNVADDDSDGDGVLDGADDQDHDDVPNMMECSRKRAAGVTTFDKQTSDSGDGSVVPVGPPAHDPKGFVNPFNPCLPLPGKYVEDSGNHIPGSRTCPLYIPVGDNAWAPFNPKDEYFYIHN
jgi:hypothetical protein